VHSVQYSPTDTAHGHTRRQTKRESTCGNSPAPLTAQQNSRHAVHTTSDRSFHCTRLYTKNTSHQSHLPSLPTPRPPDSGTRRRALRPVLQSWLARATAHALHTAGGGAPRRNAGTRVHRAAHRIHGGHRLPKVGRGGPKGRVSRCRARPLHLPLHHWATAHTQTQGATRSGARDLVLHKCLPVRALDRAVS
jgi:hypothetical protein